MFCTYIHLLNFDGCGIELTSCISTLCHGQGLRRCVEEIVFLYTYPRLDMEVWSNFFFIRNMWMHDQCVNYLDDISFHMQVSKHMNHLLKSPFCVHPKTGCLLYYMKQGLIFMPWSWFPSFFIYIVFYSFVDLKLCLGLCV